MFCPKCRAEYREGFTICSECHMALVPELPPEFETRSEFVDYEEILATYNPFDIAVIKSLLDQEDILYFFQGEQFSYVRPLADPVRLMVAKEHAEAAREILKDLTISYGPSSPGKAEEEE
jgi:hypothetical protein